MQFLIGFVAVLGCVLGGYMMEHGKFDVLMQPVELMIIFGSACGAFMISNNGTVVKGVLKGFKVLFKGAPFKKQDYIELLVMLFGTFKLIKTKGMLEIEKHIENPHESDLFNKNPKFLHNHHAETFLVDYLRLMTMGSEDYYQMEDMMGRDMEVQHHAAEDISGALTTMADGMPALGIVAAVLGVIITMGVVDQPPKILGHHIASALVGTFLGVLLSYGFIGPMGKRMGGYFAAEHQYVDCIRVGLLAHLKGNAPTISVEIARNSLPAAVRPTFKEVEDAMSTGS
jgi:chemotaxis protein MotA